MDNRDGPTEEEVAAACKEGHPVTKVTVMLWSNVLTAREGLSGFAGANPVCPADACGPELCGNADMAA